MPPPIFFALPSPEKAMEHLEKTPQEDLLFLLAGETSWLNKERCKKVRAHLAHIRRLFAEGRQDCHGQLTSFTYLMTPMERSRLHANKGEDYCDKIKAE